MSNKYRRPLTNQGWQQTLIPVIPDEDYPFFHGREEVTEGGVSAKTDTDYLRFTWPCGHESAGGAGLRLVGAGDSLEEPNGVGTSLFVFAFLCAECGLPGSFKLPFGMHDFPGIGSFPGVRRG